ncbi:MAG: serine/threonine-protein phosphatase, partial [Flavobacteriales bacterium]|nr:serine/threonine-protein phosphatase [Flavobacteriales bacterium]MCW8914150.1 serine/threonine-protein phosphatase [Flavobacteriales bacterium]MCW8967929.1 serine/threonine-protein phosphatase [Flavobacteriales bacterium]MCW8989984.1 serine/threonine-protein phosphatase [Flavobacteriales bacterium]MCW9021212.1 serine/threonine-protein phosphatase [Flavobacteriales bacterium]
NGLNRSVREHGLTEPGKILDKTREIVIQEFEKSEDDVKDGMDIALCSLKYKDGTDNAILQYAGANNPLWIIRNRELVEYKGNKQPIGKMDNPQPFTTHEIVLQKGDIIYIFTDGYADQFGGPKGKKLMYKPFKNLLLSVQEKTMDEQKRVLEQHFEDWKKSLEQVDDVCIIGVRI